VATTLTTYDLEQFVADMESLIATRPDQSTLFDKGSSYLERLVRNPNCIPEEYQRPSGKGKRANHGSYALYRGPELFVSAVVWGPGDRVGPHDHQTWGMIGVIGNEILETRYRRVDDRDKPDVAILEKDRATLVKPGDVSLLVPHVDEIHRMDNDSDRNTVEIHVYGRDLVALPRFRFDLENNRIIPFASDKFDNC
jgi:predicted metal-dependent enzyme (double-stranded beta helix superfamily)